MCVLFKYYLWLIMVFTKKVSNFALLKKYYDEAFRKIITYYCGYDYF